MVFTKMHGAGNDFIIVDNRKGEIPPEEVPELARKLCAYHTGVGADGLMLVTASKKGADFATLFYNNDGSLGEMCGNGSRCICRWGFEHGLAGKVQRVETTAGIIMGRRIDTRRYQVRLNDPSVIDLHRVVKGADGKEYDCAYVELGDPGLPHAVLRLEDWDLWDTDTLRKLGRELRFAKEFPKGANVTFVKNLGEDKLKAVTFERGVEDFTLACGTGCGSTVTALTLMGLVSGSNVTVSMPGGEIEISVDADRDKISAGNIFMTGPTALVFTGELKEIQ